MQGKAKLMIAAGMLALISTGAAVARTSVANLPIDTNPATTTVVPEQIVARPDAGADLTDPLLRTAETQTIQNVVRAQLRALAMRDASGAFARLAPSTQHYFGQPDAFFDTLAQQLPPMLNTKHFAFLALQQDQAGADQQVLITDSNGHDWIAKFQLEREIAGDWRVKGCVVEVAPGQQA